MKLIRFFNLMVGGILLAVATTACHPEHVTSIPPHQPPALTDVGPSTNLTSATQDTSSSTNLSSYPLPNQDAFSNYTANAEIFKDDTVHFAFDSSAVRKSEEHKIVTVADYLKAHPGDALRIEGHCDERGTAEYNRSLGERRALALREQLVKLGIDPNYMETVTYGFDRPVDTGHNEAAWSKNRRGEFVLLTPPAPK